MTVGDTVRTPDAFGRSQTRIGKIDLVDGDHVRVRIAGKTAWYSRAQLEDEAARLVAETPDILLNPTARRPMTNDERELARALGRCSYPPATFHKRFAREMAALAERDAPTLTEKQADCLQRMRWRYRRQLPASFRAEKRA